MFEFKFHKGEKIFVHPSSFNPWGIGPSPIFTVVFSYFSSSYQGEMVNLGIKDRYGMLAWFGATELVKFD